jgi:tight adherence protein B
MELQSLRLLWLFVLSLCVLLVVAGQLATPNARARRGIERYCDALATDLTKLRSKVGARAVLASQGVATVMTVFVALGSGKTLLLLLFPIVAITPHLALRRALARRWSNLELQIEPWIGQIANNLRATSSLGEAITSTRSLIAPPMRDEVEVLLRDTEFGTPLDEALDRMSSRIPSRTLAGTVLALKVARRSGGNLPLLFENAASALRELARLEGVLRTKTAEGRAQTAVIGVIPLPMVLAVHFIDPRFFEPLTSSPAGYAIALAALVLWLFAIASALKILAVDI